MLRISGPSLYRPWSTPKPSSYPAPLSNRSKPPVDLMTIERTRWRTHDRIFLALIQPSGLSAAVGPVT